MLSHRWHFIRSGGVDQVLIRSGADIVHLEFLDQKLWVALACPTRGIDFDARTLDLIDTDDDGRIRPPEIIAAARWIRDHVRDPDDLLRGGAEVSVDAVHPETPEGQRLAAAVREMFGLIGRSDGSVITLSAIEALDKVLAEEPFNGDGVIVAQRIGDPRTRALVEEIGAAYGWVTDRRGEAGIDRGRAERYLADLARLEAWYAQAQADPALLPLGEHTADAVSTLTRLADKIEDYYMRCAMAAYDPLAASTLTPPEALYRSIALDELDPANDTIARMPLAIVRYDCVLPLAAGVNPAWAQALDDFRRRVAEPLLGRSLAELDRAAWSEVRARLAPCSAWLASKPQTALGGLPLARIAPPDLDAVKAALLGAIERDEQAAAKKERFTQIEKLVRFQRDFVHLLNNFVSFAEFYSGRRAIFEAGTLYLDARSCDLTVEVADLAKHPVLAGLAKAYLAYCECRRAGATKHIVAVFTAGDVDYLLVGRNGVFYDRQGQDWDATIVKIVENPIDIRQAFFSPYKKFSRMIEEQVAKRAAASESGVQGKLGSLAGAVVQGAGRPGENPAPPAGRRIDVGTVAALGVALGSISTVVVAVFAKFVDLGWWIPVAVLGIVLAISGPSMLIAWLKLRQRSLAPILDASGWAINGRMKINIPLGAALSQQARLPPGAEHRLRDPFAETHRGRRIALLVILLALVCVLGWRMGAFGSWLPSMAVP